MNDEDTNVKMLVPLNTIVTCYCCGFEYEIHYTEEYHKDGDDFCDGRRICQDCIEGEL